MIELNLDMKVDEFFETALADQTLQQVFERVAVNLLKQNRWSKDEEGVCAYDGGHGRRCAVGWALPESVFKKWRAKLNDRYGNIGIAEREDRTSFPRMILMLKRLQIIHDGCKPATWRESLQIVARDMDLTFPTGA